MVVFVEVVGSLGDRETDNGRAKAEEDRRWGLGRQTPCKPLRLTPARL